MLVEEVTAHVEDQIGGQEAEGELEEDVHETPRAACHPPFDDFGHIELELLVNLKRHGRQLLARKITAGILGRR